MREYDENEEVVPEEDSFEARYEIKKTGEHIIHVWISDNCIITGLRNKLIENIPKLKAQLQSKDFMKGKKRGYLWFDNLYDFTYFSSLFTNWWIKWWTKNLFSK